MQILVCSSCGETGNEPHFHHEETEQWACPHCQMDESGILIVETDDLVRRARELDAL